jgi:hypothetical protein
VQGRQFETEVKKVHPEAICGDDLAGRQVEIKLPVNGYTRSIGSGETDSQAWKDAWHNLQK